MVFQQIPRGAVARAGELQHTGRCAPAVGLTKPGGVGAKLAGAARFPRSVPVRMWWCPLTAASCPGLGAERGWGLLLHLLQRCAAGAALSRTGSFPRKSIEPLLFLLRDRVFLFTEQAPQ